MDSDKNGFYARRIGEDTKEKTATICFELCGVDIRHSRTQEDANLGGRKLGGRTDAVGNSGAEWKPIILCAQVERFRVDRDTYGIVCICICVPRCAYINCISPLNGASWLTDCALLIRFPIIGRQSWLFPFSRVSLFRIFRTTAIAKPFICSYKRKSTRVLHYFIERNVFVL